MPFQQQGPLVYLHVGHDTYCYDTRLKPVGAGAMGTVYFGRNIKTNRATAIKMVNPKYASIQSVRNRARAESSMAFRHPNLIEMVGCCENHPSQGPMFILSNFISGVTLDQHVDRYLRPMNDAVARICRTIFPVLDALSYLHSSGITHLDIKPTNIMVEKGHSNIRLMDMGIAYTRDDHEITSPGLLGTPGYAAPEQYVQPGEHLQVDCRTDIYELGVTLYELLAQEKPHDMQSAPDIAGVPKPVMKVIRKATAYYADDRYQKAAEMKTALRDALMPRSWWQKLLGK